ncbi:hypothetical protein BJX70DRAFT_396959 [Aspergillus crustosus]
MQSKPQSNNFSTTITATLLTALALTTPTLAGQKVKAVWSTTSFNTVDGGQGQSGHSGGFNLLNEDGKDIYNARYPEGYSPCGTSGATFSVSKGRLGEADAEQDTEFFGLGIALEGKCQIDFELADGVECGEQGGLTGHRE